MMILEETQKFRENKKLMDERRNLKHF